MILVYSSESFDNAHCTALWFSSKLSASCTDYIPRHLQDHFADLLERYGSPVLVLDLVKQTERREREVIVGKEYRRAVEHVNSTMPPVGS